MSSERPPPDDEELEDFLAGRSPLSAAYREASRSESAPPELEARVLAFARESAGLPVPRRAGRWLQPLAYAASLVLTLGVVLTLWRDPAAHQLAQESDDTRPAPAAAASPEADPITAEPAVDEQVIRAIPGVETKREASVPNEAGANRRLRAASDAAAESERRSKAQSAPSLQKPALAPSAPPPPPAAAAPSEFADEVLDARDAAPAAAAAPAVSAAPKMKASRAESAAGSAGRMAPAPAQAEEAETDPQSAEAWIERLRDLNRRGELEALSRGLREFRAHYPQHPLPEDLRSFEPAE